MIKGIFFDVGGTLCKSSDNKKPSFKKILAGKIVDAASIATH